MCEKSNAQKKGAKYIIYLYWRRETNAYTEIEDTLPSLIHTHTHTHTGNFGLKIGLKVRKAYFCERGTKEGSGQKRGVGRDAEIG